MVVYLELHVTESRLLHVKWIFIERAIDLLSLALFKMVVCLKKEGSFIIFSLFATQRTRIV